MELRTVSIAIMLVTLVVWVAWDVYVAFVARDYSATFSQILLEGAKYTPALALGIGILLGHLFWPQSLPKKDEEKKE